MNKKILTFLSLLGFCSLTSFAQSVRGPIIKAIRDPKRPEHSARADVRLHDQTLITDTAAQGSPTAGSPAPGKEIKKEKRRRPQ